MTWNDEQVLYPTQADLHRLNQREYPLVYNYCCINGNQVWIKTYKKRKYILESTFYPPSAGFSHSPKMRCVNGKWIYQSYEDIDFNRCYQRYLLAVRDLVFTSSKELRTRVAHAETFERLENELFASCEAQS